MGTKLKIIKVNQYYQHTLYKLVKVLLYLQLPELISTKLKYLFLAILK
jgi:hypothetical protein